MTIPRNLSFLAEGASSTGVLGTAKGGTNLTSFTVNGIPYATSSSVLNTSSNLTFDGSNFTVTTASSTGLATVQAVGTSAKQSYLWQASASFSNYHSLVAGNAGIYASTNFSYEVDGALYQSWWTSGSEQLRLDATGNLGFGVVPSPWYYANSRAFQIGGGGSGITGALYIGGNNGNAQGFISNGYWNGSSWKYVYSGNFAASRYEQSAGSHAWYVAPSSTGTIGFTQAMTLFNSGGVSIGNTTDPGASNLSVSGIVVGGTDSAIASAHTFVKTAPANKVFTIKNANNASGDQALNILLGTNCNDTSSPLMYGGYGATTSVIIWGNGNIVNANNSYGSSSDIKLKQNISLASSQWDDVKTLGTLVSKYSLISDKTNKLQIGFIAQDVQKICPGLVYETPDRDEKNNLTGTTTLGVNYSIAYMKAFKALSEALERIETLEARLATAKIA